MFKLLKALSGDWKEEVVILRGYNACGFVGAWHDKKDSGCSYNCWFSYSAADSFCVLSWRSHQILEVISETD
ncbi:hypothetical protein OIU78_029326 [Salix suchowensis]|nr:hypothetical protein OIU78_029326 [Salix suchowensis]